MFSFHKPKIYRSLKGCCICRAKSSSSRFTDSKRYETDFEKCFRIFEKRSGEICNACVLLVKRWKKLPVGSTRNWHHVVDARAGPGTKSIMKMKAGKNKEEKKQKHKHKKVKHNKPPHSPGGLSDDVVVGEDCQSDNSSCSGSPAGSDVSDDESVRKSSSRSQSAKSRRTKAKPIRFSSFLDLTYWKKTEVCCGIIFKGINGEVLVDTSLLHPCRTCKPASDNSSHSELSSQQSSPQPEEGIQEPEQPVVATSPIEQLPTEDSEEFDDGDAEMEDDGEITSQEESQDSIIKSEDAQFLASAVLDLSIPKHGLIPTVRSITAEM